jgi:hypothetical protein
MKEALFVCPAEENSSSNAAIMETFLMTKLRKSFFILPMSQRLRSNMAAPAACILMGTIAVPPTCRRSSAPSSHFIESAREPCWSCVILSRECASDKT